MPKNKKNRRKVPITVTAGPFPSASEGSSSNPAATRTVIRRFHVLLKRQSQINRVLGRGDSSPGHENLQDELTSINNEMDHMGGLVAYQRMSTIGQGADRGGGSEKVLIEWLRELGEQERCKSSGKKFKLLEVGALKPDNYADNLSWIDPFPIDLHSQNPAIMEQDFLHMPEGDNTGKWDIISLSLVLNFVPDPKDRGRMLRLAHTMLRRDGYLFITLPLPCVMNSRYLTEELFRQLMEYLSFKRLNARWKAGGKMIYWLYQKAPSYDVGAGRSAKRQAFETKRVLRTGNRNNFTILL